MPKTPDELTITEFRKMRRLTIMRTLDDLALYFHVRLGRDIRNYFFWIRFRLAGGLEHNWSHLSLFWLSKDLGEASLLNTVGLLSWCMETFLCLGFRTRAEAEVPKFYHTTVICTALVAILRYSPPSN